MKKSGLITGVLLYALIFAGCGDSKDKEQSNAHKEQMQNNKQAVDKEALLKEIADLNGQLLNDTSMKVNRPMAYKLISKYELYVKTFIDDAQSPDFAFKAADLAQGLGDGKKSVQLYDFILENGPHRLLKRFFD